MLLFGYLQYRHKPNQLEVNRWHFAWIMLVVTCWGKSYLINQWLVLHWFQLVFMVYWPWRLSILLNCLHSHVIWVQCDVDMNPGIEVHICVLCPRGRAELGLWCKQLWLVKACWEALIQFQQHVLLHQLDNEGQQYSCTSEMIFFVRSSACTVPIDAFSVIFRWKTVFIQKYSIQFQQWDVRTILLNVVFGSYSEEPGGHQQFL